jgi:hypothetical protein
MSLLEVGNAAALAVAATWLARLTLLPAQAVRVRNAFLMQRRSPEAFAWTPSNVPADFRVEHRRAPAVIDEAVAVAKVRAAGADWEQALALVTMLVRHWTRIGPIRSDLTRTYAMIVAGVGYCSDYVRVYLAAASAIGLFCRQWAFSFDGFGGHGHTCIEIYDRQRGRWSFVDVFNNVYAVLAGNSEPLSVLELRSALLAKTPVEFRRAGPGPLGWEHFDKLLDYYRRGADQWYLWWGNDVVTRESAGFAGALSPISARLSHRVSSAFYLPPLVPVMTAENEHAMRRMERLRRQVVGTLLVVIVLALLLGLQIGLGTLARGRP